MLKNELAKIHIFFHPHLVANLHRFGFYNQFHPKRFTIFVRDFDGKNTTDSGTRQKKILIYKILLDNWLISNRVVACSCEFKIETFA